MAEPTESILAPLRKAHASVAKLLQTHPELAEPLGAILAAIVEAEDSLAQLGSRRRSRAGSGGARTAGKQKRYERHTRGGEEYLAEYRTDSPYPFRVAKAVLDALVHTLGSAKSPLRIGDVREAVSETVGETPAPYQLQTCLRYLATDGLIRMRGRTYAAIEPKILRRQVADLWKKTPQQGRT
jgi:hypothetical protein